jgi:hypothetical protein
MTDVVGVNLQTGETISRPLTPEELAANEQHLAALEAARPERERQAHNAVILAAIAKIEAERQPRAIREATLGQDGSVARLQAINSEIATLRSQLQ